MKSLEERLAENTVALNRLADAMEAAGGDKPAKPAKTEKPAKPAAKKPTVTVEQMKAAVMEVKEKVGADEAKAIIAEYGGEGAKLAALSNLPEKWDEIVADCTTALEGVNGSDDGDDI